MPNFLEYPKSGNFAPTIWPAISTYLLRFPLQLDELGYNISAPEIPSSRRSRLEGVRPNQNF